MLVGRDGDKAIEAAKKWLAADDFSWENPFGDGHVAEHILDIITGGKEEQVEKIIARNESVAVVGMGYMGLPIASLIAEAGLQRNRYRLEPR